MKWISFGYDEYHRTDDDISHIIYTQKDRRRDAKVSYIPQLDRYRMVQGAKTYLLDTNQVDEYGTYEYDETLGKMALVQGSRMIKSFTGQCLLSGKFIHDILFEGSIIKNQNQRYIGTFCLVPGSPNEVRLSNGKMLEPVDGHWKIIQEGEFNEYGLVCGTQWFTDREFDGTWFAKRRIFIGTMRSGEHSANGIFEWRADRYNIRVGTVDNNGIGEGHWRYIGDSVWFDGTIKNSDGTQHSGIFYAKGFSLKMTRFVEEKKWPIYGDECYICFSIHPTIFPCNHIHMCAECATWISYCPICDP